MSPARIRRLVMFPSHMRMWALALNLAITLPSLSALAAGAPAPTPLYTEFRDDSLSFLEATVDCRKIAPAGTRDNLIPRAVIVPLGHDAYVAFDTELLRVAAIWQNGFLSKLSYAMISYGQPKKEAQGGQSALPTPQGIILAATGLYPGWQPAGREVFADPRPRSADEGELGRGPLSSEEGFRSGIEDQGGPAVLSYSLRGGAGVRERFELQSRNGQKIILRHLEIRGLRQPLTLVVNDFGSGEVAPARFAASSGKLRMMEGRYLVCDVTASEDPQRLSIAIAAAGATIPVGLWNVDSHADPVVPTSARWGRARTSFKPGINQGSYAVDLLMLPYPNPWQRRIRPVGIAFFPDGDAVIVTFDGDVYRLSGLASGESVLWTRIAAGFNEPQSICIRGQDIFVFSRGGVSRLVDRNSDGETDFYEMFCNRFVQSANTRDYPLSLIPKPGGGFLISKGGQQGENVPSPHSGRVLSISANGERAELFAYGLRNGYLASHLDGALVTASDQQGNWVPSTPLYLIKEQAYYGYKLGPPPGETVVENPLLWLPHRVLQSGMDQVYCHDPRAGSLHGSILYVDYVRPALLKVLLSKDSGSRQAAGTLLPVRFDIPLLKGAINPGDGLPYFVGFQVEGCQAEQLEGICRLRAVDSSDPIPRQARAYREGIHLSFSQALPPRLALDPASYQVASWEYRRTAAYGSGQFKLKGEPGIDRYLVRSVLISRDGKDVFVVIDAMRKTMQLEVQHALFGGWQGVYFTVNELDPFDAVAHGFGHVDFAGILASPATARRPDNEVHPISSARGFELATQFACIGCHSIDGSTAGKNGPTWLNLFNRPRRLTDGSVVKANEVYLRTSILEPDRQIVEGFDQKEAAMPSYKGVLADDDIAAILLYIEALGGVSPAR